MRLCRATPELIREIMEEEGLCTKLDAAAVMRRLGRYPDVDRLSLYTSLKAVEADIDAGKIKQLPPKYTFEEAMAMADEIIKTGRVCPPGTGTG